MSVGRFMIVARVHIPLYFLAALGTFRNLEITLADVRLGKVYERADVAYALDGIACFVEYTSLAAVSDKKRHASVPGAFGYPASKTEPRRTVAHFGPYLSNAYRSILQGILFLERYRLRAVRKFRVKRADARVTGASEFPQRTHDSHFKRELDDVDNVIPIHISLLCPKKGAYSSIIPYAPA